jgi:hypothetical protein
MTDLVRSPLARIALAAWVNVDPDKLPPEKMWIEHPSDENRKAWDRVVSALAAALGVDAQSFQSGEAVPATARLDEPPTPSSTGGKG